MQAWTQDVFLLAGTTQSRQRESAGTQELCVLGQVIGTDVLSHVRMTMRKFLNEWMDSHCLH